MSSCRFLATGPRRSFPSFGFPAERHLRFGTGHRSQSRAPHGLPVYSCAPASSSSATASPANIFYPMALPGSSISATVQPLARAPPLATAPRPAVSLPLRRPRPATNLIRQRSTPVWLAIWRTWTVFANSQLRCANFPALIYIYASIPIAATLESLLRQTQIFRPICTDCLRHLRISAG